MTRRNLSRHPDLESESITDEDCSTLKLVYPGSLVFRLSTSSTRDDKDRGDLGTECMKLEATQQKQTSSIKKRDYLPSSA